MPLIDPEVEKVFAQWCALDPDERLQFAARTTFPSARLQAEFQALITAAGNSEAFFDNLRARIGIAGSTDDDARAARMQRFGAYRLVKLLGRGGMGAVYLAERADAEFEKQVALKVLPIGMDDADSVARFRAERQILARLVHPGIARLLDGGVSEDGAPYYVMDFVDGVPIDAYCREHSTGLEETLRLFLQVCDAVHFAHRNLVVHRDIKPGNVLVEASGQAKLLDFGIASLLADNEARLSDLTMAGGRALTPDYAAPELLAGEPVTVAVDVYSLGVLLYQLLTGERPYRLHFNSREELVDLFARLDIPRPSSKAPDALRPRLRGDLDAIVMQALQRDPRSRYSTVRALAEDIENCLARRPVNARHERSWYRLTRFVSRNRLPIAAASVVVLALVGGAAVASWQAIEARRERNLAQLQQRRAEAVKDIVTQIFNSADPSAHGGKDVSATDLLREASRTIASSQIDDPVVRIEVLGVLAGSLLKAAAIDDAEAVNREAMALIREHRPDGPEAIRAQLVDIEILRYRGQFEAQRQALVKLLPSFQRDTESVRAEYVDALKMLAHLEIDSSRFDEAKSWAAKAQEAARPLGTTTEPYIRTLLLQSVAHAFAKEPESALRYAQEACDAAKQLARNEARHPMMMECFAVLGRAQELNGRLDEAIALSQQSIAALESVYGLESTPVGFGLGQLSVMQLKQRRVSDAIESARRALAIADGEHINRQSLTYFARQMALARGLLAAREGRSAVAVYAEAIPVAPLAYAKRPDLAVFLLKLRAEQSLAVATAGDLTKAARLAQGIFDEAATRHEVAPPIAWFARGRIARLRGNAQAAESDLAHAMQEADPKQPPFERGEWLAELALARMMAGDASTAEGLMQEAEALWRDAGERSWPARQEAQREFAELLARRTRRQGV